MENKNQPYQDQPYQDIERRTFNFAVRVVKMVPQLLRNTASFELGKQVTRSGGAIHSNIVQARSGLSELDFFNHMKIACKEAKETKKWIELITAAGLTTPAKTELLLKENEEIISILVTIVKNTYKTIKRKEEEKKKEREEKNKKPKIKN